MLFDQFERSAANLQIIIIVNNCLNKPWAQSIWLRER